MKQEYKEWEILTLIVSNAKIIVEKIEPNEYNKYNDLRETIDRMKELSDMLPAMLDK